MGLWGEYKPTSSGLPGTRMTEETKELVFTKPTRFYFYYNKTNNAPTMHFCVGAAYFDCKALELRCHTRAVFQDKSPRAMVEGFCTRIEIKPNDEYVVYG